MKRMLVILMTVAWTGAGLFAQKSAVNSAYNQYGNQYWDKAKRYIDAASVHPDTKDDAKTWMFRGNIYLMIANEQIQKNPNPRYVNLCQNPLDSAFASYEKARQLDPNIKVAMQIAEPAKGLEYCYPMFYDQALKAIKERNYDWAFDRAEKTYLCKPDDEDAYYLYAYTAQLSGKMDLAKKHYYRMTRDLKVKKNEPYIRLALIYKEEGDTNRAVAVIKRHSVLKDTSANAKVDVDYAVQEAIIYAWAGDLERSMKVMDKALASDPENYVLLTNMGTELIDVKNYEKAEELLKKAGELQPDNYHVYYNLGRCYYNHSIEIAKAMNDIENDDEYAKASAQYQELLREALPFLEKAEAINGMDKNTLIMLRMVYSRLEVPEGAPDYKSKLEAVEAKLKELERKK